MLVCILKVTDSNLPVFLLQDVAKGKFASDVYVAHSIVTKDLKNVLMVTERYVM